MDTIFKLLVFTEGLACLYFVTNYVNNSLGPGWAFASLLTLAFIAAVIIEIGEKNVIK